MKPIDQMSYHPLTDKLAQVLCDTAQRDDKLFFRLMVSFYFSMAAAHMRCSINTPDRGAIPVNMYALNLAPSGYGKTLAANFMEGQVLSQFRHRFLNETFQLLGEDNLPKLAVQRAARKGTDPDNELLMVQKEFENLGPLLFSFDSGTAPAVKQMRHQLLMANAGALNLIMDEVGANLSPNKEVFDTFIELYDTGQSKQKLIKNTNDNKRSEEIVGKTPANLLMFGVPQRVLDGGKTEEDMMEMLSMGYARRCFFGYVRGSKRKAGRTAEQMYIDRTNKTNDQFIASVADRLESLADIVNGGKSLLISRETCIMLNEYQLLCEEQADRLPDHQEIRKREISERNFKVLKLAGAYAFIDDSPEVLQQHVEYAIKLAEDSGEAFHQLLSRDKSWVRLAKYVANVGQDVTHADLAEDLPFYRGSASVKQDMLNMAIAYGYKNNIIIKKSFQEGIEFLRGECLKETDLSNMIVSWSTDIATDYHAEIAPFNQLHKLTQKDGLHWVNHHLAGGHRNEENAIAGFNMIVLDVEKSVTIQVAKELLKDYKFLLYTTKRHTDDEHRFRIVLPVSHTLSLDAKDFKDFMNAVFDWLPFEVDRQTNQRARKWLSNDGTFEYNEGMVLDALPFIPRTTKSEERKKILNGQQTMDNLERWVMNNIGDGNRNVMLHRYAMILIDAGLDFEGIRQRVTSLNDKIADKLDEAEIMGTVMITVAKEMSKR
jgi:hypothetical protein